MGDRDDSPYMGMGARSPGRQGRDAENGMQWVSVGFEQVLLVAALEPDFLEALLADRDAAVKRRGLELTPVERSLLFSASDEQLRTMVSRIDTSEANLQRRGFMGKVAATVMPALSPR